MRFGLTIYRASIHVSTGEQNAIDLPLVICELARLDKPDSPGGLMYPAGALRGSLQG